MVSIEAWRAAIGRHNKSKPNATNKTSKLHSTLWAPSLRVSILVATVMSAALIGTLLRIGGVETNPGPTQNDEGKHTIYFVNKLISSNFTKTRIN